MIVNQLCNVKTNKRIFDLISLHSNVRQAQQTQNFDLYKVEDERHNYAIGKEYSTIKQPNIIVYHSKGNRPN